MKKHLVVPPLLCVAFAAGGCGAGSEDSVTDDATSLSASPASSAPAEVEDSTPAVSAATGARLRFPSAQLRLPDKTWTAKPADKGSGGGYAPRLSGQLFVNEVPTITDDPDLDELLDLSLADANRNESFAVRVGPERDLDGVPVAVLEGRGGGEHLVRFETVVLEPQPAYLTLEIRTTGSAALHRERVEAVVASWQWR